MNNRRFFLQKYAFEGTDEDEQSDDLSKVLQDSLDVVFETGVSPGPGGIYLDIDFSINGDNYAFIEIKHEEDLEKVINIYQEILSYTKEGKFDVDNNEFVERIEYNFNILSFNADLAYIMISLTPFNKNGIIKSLEEILRKLKLLR